MPSILEDLDLVPETFVGELANSEDQAEDMKLGKKEIEMKSHVKEVLGSKENDYRFTVP